MKIAIKYLPGVGGEFLMSLISSKILNKPFNLNEKNHYDCTQFDCGHQSFAKVFHYVYFAQNPDYSQLISDSVGKTKHINSKNNIFKYYDRITLHCWTLNILAEMQIRDFKRIMYVRDSNEKGRRLARAKVGTLVGRSDLSEKDWEDLVYNHIHRKSEDPKHLAYAKKCFDVVECDYESLYNNTFNKTKKLIKSFCDVEIDQTDYSLIRSYYEANEAILASSS